MYVDDAQQVNTSLLQGDILIDVQILGALNLGSIQHHSPATGGEPTGWSVSVPPHTGCVLVLSHSCEIDRRNNIKVTSIVLAPLRDVSKATDAERIQELIESNLIDRDSPQASFLKYFYLAPHDRLPFIDGAVADFSKLFSVRKNSYDHLLERKAAELTAAVRSSMALKLALYFHRLEERAA